MYYIVAYVNQIQAHYRRCFSGRLGILDLEDICYAIISEERCFIIVINKLDVQC